MCVCLLFRLHGFVNLGVHEASGAERQHLFHRLCTREGNERSFLGGCDGFGVERFFWREQIGECDERTLAKHCVTLARLVAPHTPEQSHWIGIIME